MVRGLADPMTPQVDLLAFELFETIGDGGLWFLDPLALKITGTADEETVRQLNRSDHVNLVEERWGNALRRDASRDDQM